MRIKRDGDMFMTRLANGDPMPLLSRMVFHRFLEFLQRPDDKAQATPDEPPVTPVS